jgi:hypothetical protein
MTAVFTLLIPTNQFQIGQAVRVRVIENERWTNDWQNQIFIVVSIECDYRKRSDRISYGLSTNEDIESRHGWTDEIPEHALEAV